MYLNQSDYSWKTLVVTLLFPLLVSIPPLTYSAHRDVSAAEGSWVSNNKNGWYLGVGGGYTARTLNHSTSVLNGVAVPAPFDRDQYSIKTRDTGNVSGVAGYYWQGNATWLAAYAVFVQYTHFFSNRINGSIDQFSLPGFRNYTYHLNLSSNLYTIGGKLNVAQYHGLMPYVAGAVGFAINSVTYYNETALPTIIPRNSPEYSDYHQTNWAATLGAGIDYKFCENFWLTLGYEHVFQPKIYSGNGAVSWASERLKLGSLRLDSVFVQLNYQIFPNA